MTAKELKTAIMNLVKDNGYILRGDDYHGAVMIETREDACDGDCIFIEEWTQ